MFSSINLTFYEECFMLWAYPHEGTNMFAYALCLKVHTCKLDRQVASAAQTFNTLRTSLSTVEYFTLERDAGSQGEAHRTQWHDLLRSLGNLKTLRVLDSLVGDLSRCLRSDDMEPPLELLPELKVIEYTATNNPSDAFASFIDARKNTGHPVALVHR